ncbi:abc transporter g family member 28 [Quercus suber]|uniref:Abc transporter g family member 28 n=1 Tax=Quercus suber TaxID=58331 RepID=A0AAW0JF10_QUESU
MTVLYCNRVLYGPDHLIDIVEGIVIPGGSSGVSHEDLAVRWMLHKGYSAPPDMQQFGAGLARSSIDVIPVSETNPVGSGMKVHSFAGELQVYASNTNTLLVAKQQLREARMLAMDYLILLLAGACLASLIKVNDRNFGEDAYIYTIIAVSLLCKVAALRTFSLDKLHYWRESGSGMSSQAYFLSKDTVDHFNTVIKPAVYLSMFYFFTNPRSSFADNYLVLFCLVYCVTGTAYAFAIIFESGIAHLCSVLLPVVLTLVGTQPKDSEFMKILAKFCYPNWALEAFIIANAER